MIPPTDDRQEESPKNSGAASVSATRWIPPDVPVGAVRMRIPGKLMMQMLTDLQRPHPFAAERVGFLSVGIGTGEDGEVLVIGGEYRAAGDHDYLRDDNVGARIGAEAIREALQWALASGRGIFHVHMHPHYGVPNFSFTDATELPHLAEAIRRGAPAAPHGMLVLSRDAANAWVWTSDQPAPCVPAQIAVVGRPMRLISPLQTLAPASACSERYQRQGFLGPHAESLIGRARIGVVGLSGGGSHVVQQLAHVGFRQTRGFDGDHVDESNLNRLVGARAIDASLHVPKGNVAERVTTDVLPDANFIAFHGRWQENAELLRGCDVVVGCVDSFAERQQLEVACRRYAIPYVDIGMDVHQVDPEPPRLAGQLILSMPDAPCMFCLGFLNEERLAQEAARYGAAGDRPQVVWPNGVLASTAVGLVVDLVTGWSGSAMCPVYLSYDGNTGSIQPHPRLQFLGTKACPHYAATDVGDPNFRKVRT